MKKLGNSLRAVTMVALLVAGTACLADTITCAGSPCASYTGSTGTGFGSITSILAVQNNGTEQGAVVWNGTSDVGASYSGGTGTGSYTIGGANDASIGPPHSSTVTGAQLYAAGITNQSSLGLIFQVNNDGHTLMTLNNLTLYVWSANGSLATSIACGGSPNPCGLDYAGVGTGSSGYLFLISGNSLDAYINSSSTYHFGLGVSGGTPTSTSDGPDNLYFVQVSGNSEVPEPATLTLFGAGVAGLVSRLKLRKRA